jgi:hypothetical protein
VPWCSLSFGSGSRDHELLHSHKAFDNDDLLRFCNCSKVLQRSALADQSNIELPESGSFDAGGERDGVALIGSIADMIIMVVSDEEIMMDTFEAWLRQETLKDEAS